ncbi:hypothetical protein [Chryseobacterium sp. SIMBA_038]|uniref:hypothetical protein n=1 Tax=Chryseobacterium sp. SIMBA_038 TaxID=3085780 RepID=UPI00397CDD66
MKNKFLIFILILVVGSIYYYFHTPSINEKDMVYFDNAKDSIIKNHEYFMTHNLEPILNPSDKIIFSKERGFVTNESYFDLLKRKEGDKTFFNPINILYNKKLVVDANNKYSVSNSIYINEDSTIQFIIYQKPRFEGYKIGYLLYAPKHKLKMEKGYGYYDVEFEKDGWRFIKAVEPYLNND